MPSSAAAFVAEALGLAVDAQQVGVLARQAHDVLLPAEVDPVVPVRDPTLQQQAHRPRADPAGAASRATASVSSGIVTSSCMAPHYAPPGSRGIPSGSR